MFYFRTYKFPALCVKALVEKVDNREFEYSNELIQIEFNVRTSQYQAIFKGEIVSPLQDIYQKIYPQIFKPSYIMGDRDEFSKDMDTFIARVIDLISFA